MNVEHTSSPLKGEPSPAASQKSDTRSPSGGKIIEDCMTSDLERKKAEQAKAREAIKKQRKAGIDVDGSLGHGRLSVENIDDV